MDHSPDDEARSRALETALREPICAAGRRLGSRGLIVAAEGNLSVRMPKGVLLMTPTGRRKDELRPDELLAVALDQSGAAVIDAPAGSGSAPSSDIAIHRAVYAARPDVVAVVHAHVAAAMALTLAGKAPDPTALPETAHHLPVLPLVPFEAMGSEALAARVAAALTPADGPLPGAVLLERHGALAVGTAGTGAGVDADDLEAALTQAVDRLELVDVLCRTWRDAILLRGSRTRSL